MCGIFDFVFLSIKTTKETLERRGKGESREVMFCLHWQAILIPLITSCSGEI